MKFSFYIDTLLVNFTLLNLFCTLFQNHTLSNLKQMAQLDAEADTKRENKEEDGKV